MPDLAVFRRADWLTRRRVVGLGAVVLALETAFILFIAAWQHGAFFTVEHPTSSDFVSFYAAGKLALAGTPHLAYDQAAHYLAQEQARIPGAPYQYFFYPPVFLLLCAALATLPYFVAYYLFQAATLGLFLAAMRRILGIEGWGWAIPVLAFPAVFWNIGVGQNAFLTAALFAGFTLALDRRPIAAGSMLGLMCYKPHFGMIAPFALAAGGHWRAFLAAGAMVGALVGLSVGLFGVGTWSAYAAAAAGSNQVYESGRIDLAGMITVFGALRLTGAPAPLAWFGQIMSAVAMAILTVMVWRQTTNTALRSAVLLAATLLAVPLALVYDQLLILVATGWLLREARQTGFLAWEKLVLAALYPLSVVLWVVGTGWQIPLGPFLHTAILALCLRRVWGLRPVRAAGARTVPQQDQAVAGATP